MKRIRLAPAALACIGLIVLSISCTSAEKAEPLPTAATTPLGSAGASDALTHTVGSILTEDGWEGRDVTIVGYYRGWDLLRESGQAPPVTRSDWVITDDSGAIYVQMNAVEIEGTEELEVLNPHAKEATSHVVRVTGVVRITPQGQRYVEPTRIELVK